MAERDLLLDLASEAADNGPWPGEELDEELVPILAASTSSGASPPRRPVVLAATRVLAGVAGLLAAAACLFAGTRWHRPPSAPGTAVPGAVGLNVVTPPAPPAGAAGVALKAWSARDVPLSLLVPESGARCLDGSPAGFYLDRATDEASKDKWAVLMEGGSKCLDAATCQVAATSERGSSTHFPANMGAMPILFWIRGNMQENPHFGSWNRVYVPYCSQDLWSGTRVTKSPETFGYYFSGHVILKVLIQHLIEQERMGAATDLLFGGYSAGGIGSWLNARYVFSQLPSLQRAVHVPIAGFYLPQTAGPFMDPTLKNMSVLWQAHVDDGCKSGMVPGEEYRCMLASYSARFATWKIFLIQAQSDLIQLGCGNACDNGRLDQWRVALTQAIGSSLKASDGFFSPACYMHHLFHTTAGPWIFDPATLKEVDYLEALWNFYSGRAVRLADSCGIRCGHCAAPGPR